MKVLDSLGVTHFKDWIKNTFVQKSVYNAEMSTTLKNGEGISVSTDRGIKLMASSTNSVTVGQTQNEILGDTLFRDGEWSVSKVISGATVDDAYVKANAASFMSIENAPSFINDATDFDYKILKFVGREIFILVIPRCEYGREWHPCSIYADDVFFGKSNKVYHNGYGRNLSGIIISVYYYITNTVSLTGNYRAVYETIPTIDPNALEIAVNIGKDSAFYVSALKGELKSDDYIRIYRNIRQRYRFFATDTRTYKRINKKGWIAYRTNTKGPYLDILIKENTVIENPVTKVWTANNMAKFIFDTFSKCVTNNDGTKYIRLCGGTGPKETVLNGGTIRQRFGVAVIRDGKVISNIAPFNLKCKSPRGVITEDNWQEFLCLERA